MKIVKSILITLFSLVIFLIIVPLFLDFSKYAVPYINQAEKTIGRRIQTGKIHLQIFPTPRISVDNVEVGNLKNSVSPFIVKLSSVKVVFSLQELIKGKIAIDQLLLNAPIISLEKDKNGKENWEFSLPIAEKESAEKSSVISPAAPIAASVLVKNVTIENAKIIYMDLQKQSTMQVDDINLKFFSPNIQGPYYVDGNISLNGLQLDLKTTIHPLKQKKLPVALTIAGRYDNKSKIQTEIQGYINIEALSFNGKLTATTSNLPYQFALPAQKIDLHKDITLTTALTITADSIAFPSIKLNHDLGVIQGNALYDFSSGQLETKIQFAHDKDQVQIALQTYDMQSFAFHISSDVYQNILQWVAPESNFHTPFSIKGLFKKGSKTLVFEKTKIICGDIQALVNVAFAPISMEAFLNGIIYQGNYILDLVGKVQQKNNTLDVSFEKIHVQDKSSLNITASASLSLDTSKKKPHITGTITAKPIQLVSYHQEIVRFISAVFYNTFYQVIPVAAHSTRWSKEPINFPLDVATCDIKIDIPKLTAFDLTLEKLNGTLKIHNAKLSLPFVAKLYSGNLEGALHLSSEKKLLELTTLFSGVNISKIPALRTHFRKGQAFGRLTLQTLGKSINEWVQQLRGAADFSIREGIALGFDLPAMVRIAKKPLEFVSKGMFERNFKGEGETPFSLVSAAFDIKNGVATTENLVVEAADAEIKCQGKIDIFHWYLQMRGAVNLTTIKNFPHLPFIIEGSIDQPNYHLDTSVLGKFFLKQGGKVVQDILKNGISELGKVLPKAANNNAHNQQNESNAQKPEKVVKNILKGIFG